MRGLRIRLLGWASAAALLASGAVAGGAAALAVSVTTPGVGTVEARLPAVEVPTVTVPSVTVPSITVPSVPPPPAPVPPLPSTQTPSVQTPSVQTPSVQAPAAPTAPSVGGVRQAAAGGAGATTAAGPETADAGGGTAAAGNGSDEPGSAASDDTIAGQRSADAPRARRDRIAAGGSPSHSAGGVAAQHRLEVAVEDARQCLDNLGPGERRVLGLRAGIGPRSPLTRAQVANRLDLGVAQTGRIERRGLRHLDALAGAGACGGTATTAGSLMTAGARAGANGDAALAADASDHRARFGVGGVVAHGDDPSSGGRSGLGALPPPIGDGGEATLLVALGLLVALALLVRRELLRR